MSTAPVEAMGKLSATPDWKQTKPEWDGLVRTLEADVMAASVPLDGSHLSPLAQLVATLDALRESAPAKYVQVTRQIGTNLLNAAQIAVEQDNSDAAGPLLQLAADFAAASANGQLHTLMKDLSASSGGTYTATGSGANTVRNVALDQVTLIAETISTVVIGTQSS